MAPSKTRMRCLRASRKFCGISWVFYHKVRGLSEGGFRLLTGRGELLPVAQLGKAELYLLEDVEAVAAQRAP
jgi:hypothetical protein